MSGSQMKERISTDCPEEKKQKNKTKGSLFLSEKPRFCVTEEEKLIGTVRKLNGKKSVTSSVTMAL